MRATVDVFVGGRTWRDAAHPTGGEQGDPLMPMLFSLGTTSRLGGSSEDGCVTMRIVGIS